MMPFKVDQIASWLGCVVFVAVLQWQATADLIHSTRLFDGEIDGCLNASHQVRVKNVLDELCRTMGIEEAIGDVLATDQGAMDDQSMLLVTGVVPDRPEPKDSVLVLAGETSGHKKMVPLRVGLSYQWIDDNPDFIRSLPRTRLEWMVPRQRSLEQLAFIGMQW